MSFTNGTYHVGSQTFFANDAMYEHYRKSGKWPVDALSARSEATKQFGRPVAIKHVNGDTPPLGSWAIAAPHAGTLSEMGLKWTGPDTPALAAITEFQNWDTELQLLLLLIIGRALSPVTDMWKIFPYFMGMSNAGKSQVLCLIQNMFADHLQAD